MVSSAQRRRAALLLFVLFGSFLVTGAYAHLWTDNGSDDNYVLVSCSSDDVILPVDTFCPILPPLVVAELPVILKGRILSIALEGSVSRAPPVYVI
jgi:hypothetical protein